MLLFFDIGSSELLLIFLVIIIFFGANKIPEIAKGLGKGIRQFKDASAGIQREIEKGINEQAETKKAELPKVNEPENTVAQNTVAQKLADSSTPKPEEESKQ